MNPLYRSLLFCISFFWLLPAMAQSSSSEYPHLKAELLEARQAIQDLIKENQQLRVAPALAYQKQVDRLAYRHRMNMRKQDSLQYELESTKRILRTLNRVEKLEKTRIAYIEQKERELNAFAAELQRQNQLAKSRESHLSQSNLNEQEHQLLLQKLRDQEKKLKMLEQRLRAMSASNGSSMGK